MPHAERPHVNTVLPLVQGELSARDAAELQALKALIQEKVGFHCHNYKEKCLRRRIAVRMRSRAVESYAAYAELLQRDAEEYRTLVDTITINVSKFFRNAEAWQALRERVVPALFELDVPAVRIWSAGAATGEEAYTMAIVLREHAEANSLDASRFAIVGTDIDRASLAAAQRAEYGAFSFTETPAAALERWFVGDGVKRPRDELRAMVGFRRLDLLCDAFPAAQHLIICRNVLIYFEREAQERLFERFHRALAPAGFLMLGKVEALFGNAATGLQPLVSRERIYRRT
jgi:chemotaxis protein methyltransferase CheR